MKTNRTILACALAAVFLLPLPARPLAGSGEEAAQVAATGQKALAAGEYEEARLSFEKLAELEPNVAEVHATLAAIQFKLHEYELAVREVRTALRLKPSLPNLESLLGLSLSELGQYPDALPGLEKGFKRSADPEVRRMCGLELLRAYTGLNRDADAVETALLLNKLYPDDAEILYHSGRIYGNFAYITMEKLHEKAPGSIWLFQAQAEALESQKNYDGAIVAFDHVLVLDPGRPGVHFRLGRVYLARFNETHQSEEEERESATREFKAELAIDPANGNAGYELANIQANLGNLKDAEKLFEQVLKRFPGFEEAEAGLGGVLLKARKPAPAAQHLRRATALRADDEVAWYRLAQAERMLGDLPAQRQALAAFLKLHASSGSSQDKAASVHSQESVTPQKLDAEDLPQ